MVRFLTAGVANCDRLGNLFTNRATPGAIRVLPCQAILFAWSADDALCVLVHIVSLARFGSVFLLRFHVAVADLNGVEFIASNTAVQKFLYACFAIEVPFATLLHNRYRKWPILVADDEKCALSGLRIHRNGFLFVGLGSKVRSTLPVPSTFSGKYDPAAFRTKNLRESSFVPLRGSSDQRVGSLLRRIKGLGA